MTTNTDTYPYPKDVPYPPPGGQQGGDDASPEPNEDARNAAELTDAEAEIVDRGGPVDESTPTDVEADRADRSDSADPGEPVDESARADESAGAGESARADADADLAGADAGAEAEASDDDVEAAAVEIADQQDEAEAAGPERAERDVQLPESDAQPAERDALPEDPTSADMAGPDRAVGVAPVAAENKSSVWSDDAAEDARRRWHEVQTAFVDDPRAATEQARELVASTVDSLVAALTKQREALDAERHDDGADTELLRLEMRRYREVLDRVLGA